LTSSSFLNTLTVTLGPREVCRSDPGSMMSEVWEGEQIAKESSNGRAHHWKVEPVVLLASIGQRFQFVEQSPRMLQ